MNFIWLTGLLSIPVIAFGWDQRRKRQAMKRVEEALKTFEEKYQNLRNQHMAVAMTSEGKETEKMREFVQKVILIVKPEIDSFINEALIIRGIKSYLKPSKTQFPNVVSLVNEWAFQQGGKTQKKAEQQVKEFRQEVRTAFEDGISADIENRILNWEAGKPME